MSTGKRIAPLSQKSTDKLAAWVMENEDHPLAEAYAGACTSTVCVEQWGKAEGEEGKAAYQRAVDLTWDARHEIGRLILRMIKEPV